MNEHSHVCTAKVCSGPLYPWQQSESCLDLDRLLWQITLADVLKWFSSKYRVPGLYLASVGGSPQGALPGKAGILCVYS